MKNLKEVYKQNQNVVIVFSIIFIYFLHRMLSFRFGINYEEGRDANGYLLFLQGYLPYRDFEWVHGPFSFLFFPFIMKVFGSDLIVLRISYIVFGSLIIPLTYCLAKRILPPLWAAIAAFLSIVLLDMPYYSFNHIFITLGTLASLLMICRFIDSNNKVKINLFLSGIFTAVVALTKPLLSGACLFMGISAYLLLANYSRSLKERFKNCFVFIIGLGVLLLIFFLYFYFQTTFKNQAIKYPLFAPDSLIFIRHIHAAKINTLSIVTLFERLKNLILLPSIIEASSLLEFKRILVISYDSLIFFLPLIVSIALFIIYIGYKFNRFSSEFKEKFSQDKKFLTAFVFFNIFVYLESLKTIHMYCRAYIIQVSFILMVYILYCVTRIFSHKIRFVMAFAFLFYISFLHFFWYPYSAAKKFTESLNLVRAKGIYVSPAEKELYESLSRYLTDNFKKEEKMVILGSGYHPQFSFLTEKTNLFWDNEFMSAELDDLAAMHNMGKNAGLLLTLFENKVINRMEKERPKIVLILTDNLFQDLEDSNSLPVRIKDYLKKRYLLDKVFPPADIHGMGSSILSWVSLYKLKE